MTAPSPSMIKSAAVTFTIKTDGKAIDSTISVVAIETFSCLNKIPRAIVTIFDGNAAEADFPASNSKAFLPGAKIEILAGYMGQSETLIFSGIAVKQAISIAANGAPELSIECCDPAKAMTLARHNAFFENAKDSDVIGKLISKHGLKKKVTATSAVHPELVQYFSSDWDMMVLRAAANGMVVLVENGAVEVAPPDTSTTPVLETAFGESILEFHAELDAASQIAPSAIESAAWDPAQQKPIQAKGKKPSLTEAGNIASQKLASVFDEKNFEQQTAAEIDQKAVQSWSDAQALRSGLAKIRGTVAFQGSALAKTGKMITLGGVGERFNGPVYVSAVEHTIRDGFWRTKATLGLSEKSYAETTTNIAAPEAAGLIPPMKGLQVGLVKKVAKDPGGEYRVEIELPMASAAGNTIWARLATFYASNKVGAVFYPEVGDEVIVGCMNDDPRFPVILGSTYSKKNPPPIDVDEKNQTKGLVTRSELSIKFDDKDKIITITTPAKQTLTLDDKSGSVTIADKNKNSITMDSGGIAIESGSDLKIKAKGNVSIDAGGNLESKATGNVTTKGTQIEQKANAKFAASGNASAELKSSGIVTVKGTLVKIN